jgi:hypothetical protein
MKNDDEIDYIRNITEDESQEQKRLLDSQTQRETTPRGVSKTAVSEPTEATSARQEKLDPARKGVASWESPLVD